MIVLDEPAAALALAKGRRGALIREAEARKGAVR
jgi:hypothetical protein